MPPATAHLGELSFNTSSPLRGMRLQLCTQRPDVRGLAPNRFSACSSVSSSRSSASRYRRSWPALLYPAELIDEGFINRQKLFDQRLFRRLDDPVENDFLGELHMA